MNLKSLFLVGLLSVGAWLQEFDFDPDPSRLTNPPVAWEEARIPSGDYFPYYAYEVFVDDYDWFNGDVVGRRLMWNRASYWIPDQPFGLMLLQEDNTWKQIGIVYGPMVYYAMDSFDGDAIVMRLQAL